MKEIILSKMYLKKLFNFFFYRNKKIMTSLIYMITLFLVTFAYIIVFFVNVNKVIKGFSDGSFGYSSFMLILLIVLIFLSVYIFIQFNKLKKETEFSFSDEIAKTYPVNSTEKITIDEKGIKSLNSSQNHVFYFQFNDIACYYKYKDLYVFESKEDNFIIFEANNYDKKLIENIIKENKLNKKIILKSFKRNNI